MYRSRFSRTTEHTTAITHTSRATHRHTSTSIPHISLHTLSHLFPSLSIHATSSTHKHARITPHARRSYLIHSLSPPIRRHPSTAQPQASSSPSAPSLAAVESPTHSPSAATQPRYQACADISRLSRSLPSVILSLESSGRRQHRTGAEPRLAGHLILAILPLLVCSGRWGRGRRCGLRHFGLVEHLQGALLRRLRHRLLW